MRYVCSHLVGRSAPHAVRPGLERRVQTRQANGTRRAVQACSSEPSGPDELVRLVGKEPIDLGVGILTRSIVAPGFQALLLADVVREHRKVLS